MNCFSRGTAWRCERGWALAVNEAADGKVLLVNVWGTWCPPCRRKLPDLAAASKKYKSQGFEISGLNSESEMGAAADELIQQITKEFGINPASRGKRGLAL